METVVGKDVFNANMTTSINMPRFFRLPNIHTTAWQLQDTSSHPSIFQRLLISLAIHRRSNGASGFIDVSRVPHREQSPLFAKDRIKGHIYSKWYHGTELDRSVIGSEAITLMRKVLPQMHC
jgi:hypothetical protein